MPIQHIHTYLVHPGKGSETSRHIGGASVSLEGKLFRLLDDVYCKSDHECDIEISFNPSTDGQQLNSCRNLILDYLREPTLDCGRQLTERLEKVTTHRSGLGLLFLIVGQESEQSKIVISRFPADSAILAEENQQDLTVAFLEKVFMKSATAYKAALYQDSSLESGFWSGKAVDKQVSSRVVQLSNYWIAEFLESDFRTTPAAGTRRLAVALRDAARKATDVAVKREIAAAVTLANCLEGQTISIRAFGRRFGLSDVAMQAITAELRTATVVDELFQFDSSEFREQVPYRSVELNSGAMLTAQSAEFDTVFERELVDSEEQIVRYSTEGRIVSERLGKSR